MGKTIVIAAQKGGVAKTTTTWAMIAGLTRKGYKVLGVDFDPQGNLSFNAGIDKDNVSTLFDVIQNNTPIQEILQHTTQGDIIPGNRSLSILDFTKTGREYQLKKALQPIKNDYDFILIDTPPELGDLCINAFTASDCLISVATASAFSANGIQDLAASIQAVQEYCNPGLKILGVLLVKFNPRTNIGKTMRDVTDTYAKDMGSIIFSSTIRNATVVEETQAMQTDLFTYAPSAPVTKDYEEFINEFLKSI